ncbi:MAG: hypothetical protein IPF79_08935 [Ignavibacteria bacterium]|nr:hypothetical protein [Ignavibacteria bacterium]
MHHSIYQPEECRAYFTCIDTLCGFVYLAVVMDLFSRRIVGWYTAETMTQDLTITALKRAMW